MNFGKHKLDPETKTRLDAFGVKSTGVIPAAGKISTRVIAAICFLVVALAAEGNREPAPAGPGGIKKPVQAPVYYPNVVFQPDNRRDPFWNPLNSKNNSKSPADEEVDRGPAPPGIAGTYIAQAVLKGISIQDGSRTAVMRGADKRLYFLREGDRLFDGYVKSIDMESVTLVRETRMKSGKTLTQEVIMRLRTP